MCFYYILDRSKLKIDTMTAVIIPKTNTVALPEVPEQAEDRAAAEVLRSEEKAVKKARRKEKIDLNCHRKRKQKFLMV